MKNNTFKKSLSIILSLIMIMSTLSMLTVMSSADNTVYTSEDGLWKYYVYDDGTAGLFKYTGPNNVLGGLYLKIPDTIDGHTLTVICQESFYRFEDLLYISIPDSVKTIEKYAFYDCEKLEEIDFGSAVSLQHDGSTITVGNDLTIEKSAFYACNKLKEIDITNRIIEIEDSAFSSCQSLTRINVDERNQFYCDVDGVLFSKDMTDLVCYPAGRTNGDYTLPEGVLKISPNAFTDSKHLMRVRISETVEEIGHFAFYGCDNLIAVYIPDTTTSIGNKAFYAIDSIVIYGNADSYTERYSGDNRIEFSTNLAEFETICAYGTFFTGSDDKSYEYYYKDSYFDKSALNYNHSLATMSLCLAFSTYAYGDCTTYDKNVHQLLTGCGLDNYKGCGFDNYKQYSFNEEPTADSIGCAIASKVLPDGTPLVAVAVRSGGYKAEWASNFKVGLTGDHDGFDEAATKVVDNLKNYIQEYGLTGKIKIWITGFSRGAATATQAAAKLNKTTIENVELSNERIYAYGFATPAGAIKESMPEAVINRNIYNIVHFDDIVPLIAPGIWGFDRYGKTRVFVNELNSKRYPNYLENMKNRFNEIDGGTYEFDLCEAQVGLLNRLLVLQVANSISVYNSIPGRLAYCLNFQESIMKIFEGLNVNNNWEIIDAVIELLSKDELTGSVKILLALNLASNVSLAAALNYKYLALAHANQSYYLAWMQSMDSNYCPGAKSFFTNGDCRFACINCPVDVNVYDKETNKLVASIINEEPIEIEDSTIVSMIDENGQKKVYLPLDGDYRIETVSREDTEVTVSVIEEYGVSGLDSRVCNFSNMTTEAGDVINVDVPAYSDEEIENGAENGSSAQYTLTVNEDVVEPTLDAKGIEQVNEHKYVVEVDFDEEDGFVYGSGEYIEDTFVKLIAESRPMVEFDGFYLDGEKLTDDDSDNDSNTVRVQVKGDMNIEAKFNYVGFPDVHEGDWFYDAVKYCATHGFITGYKNGNFGPADALQRQDFVVILARIAGAELDSYDSCKLTDVDMNAYYGKAVAWAVDKGIIGGYDNGKFGVGDKITREQVATILYRYMGSPDVDTGVLDKFPDKGRISAFALNAIAWANTNGVINGKADGTLAPVATASRAEIATIIMRMDKQGMFNE